MAALRTFVKEALRASSSSVSSSSTTSAASSSARRLFSSSAKSNVHHLPKLPERIKDGCMPLLSKSTVEMLWNEHQSGLLEKLNAEVAGSELENATLVHTILSTSTKPEDIMAFNYASQALNNAFFLAGIVSPAGISQTAKDNSYMDLPVSEPTKKVEQRLTDSYGSVTQFKNAFSSAAYGMSGSGYLWLVWDTHTRKLGIVPTYGAGTILVQKRQQRGPPGFEQQASVTDNSNSSSSGESSSDAATAADANGPAASRQAISPSTRSDVVDAISSASSSSNKSDRILTPLLCLSVNEHAWLPDWGVCGKEEYLIRFWDAVDWKRIDALMS